MHVNTHDTTYENAYDDDDNSYDFTRLGFQVQAKLDDDQRWSTWSSVEKGAHGPEPRPDWVITEDGAVDTDLGILKTGKEADVFLLERAVPDDPDRRSVLAAKRYRGKEHRQFHRDRGTSKAAGSAIAATPARDGQEVTLTAAPCSRSVGRRRVRALSTLWSAGVPVPYPVQIDGTEILMEFIDVDGAAAPRLAQTRPDRATARVVLRAAPRRHVRARPHGTRARRPLAVQHPGAGRSDRDHRPPAGDRHREQPVGVDFLLRDCRNVCSWFTSRGLEVDADELLAELLAQAW